MRDVGGAVLVGHTTASEFGGVNVTRTKLHGTTHNPWQHGKTPGGSSGGTAAAVSGGLVHARHRRRWRRQHPHSRRLHRPGRAEGHHRSHPAGARWRSTATSRSPSAASRGRCATPPAGSTCATASTPATRSACRGSTGWEAGLGTHLEALRGARVAFAPTWGNATVSPVMWELLEAAGDAAGGRLRHAARRRHRHVAAADGRGVVAQRQPRHRGATGRPLAAVRRRPHARDPLRHGAWPSASTTRRHAPRSSVDVSRSTRRWPASSTRSMVSTSSSPPATPTSRSPPTVRCPACSAASRPGPATTVGSPSPPTCTATRPSPSRPARSTACRSACRCVGRHFTEQLLLDLALTAERNRPWPLVAPGSPV